MNKHHTYYLNCEEAPQQIYRHKYYMNGALPSGKTDWKNKPSDWSDIRTDCPENSIALYAGELGSNYIIENGILTWANPNVYLQSSGTQYIDTGLIGKGNSTTIDFAYSSSNDNQAVFGARQASNVKMFELAQLAGGGGRFDYNNSTTSLGFGASVKHICKTKITDSYYTVERYNSDGVLQNSYNFTLTNFETPYTLDLFARNNNGTVNAFSTDAKIYYFKIFENGVLVRHFVPVPSGLVIGDFTCTSDGMFDIVNQQFYANQGTGDFTYGKDSVDNDYDNLGFTATCSGGYNVFIDGVQYGSTYTSGTRCSITWSTSGITTGDDITTPSAMKAHKIWIEPATEGNNFSRFRCSRVAASGTEQQGVLWMHFNISNNIILESASTDSNNYQYTNGIFTACTAKNNIINLNTASASAFSTSFADTSTEYVPVINGNNGNYNLYRVFRNCTKLPKITFKDINAETGSSLVQTFLNCRSIKKLPEINLTNTTNMSDYVTNAVALENTVLDASAATGLTKIGCYGTSTYFMNGFKGLRVSNQAPFNNATAPQINISYTGMDRQALVTLFNDLPTVSSGQIINITGCTGSADLTYQDVSIAVDKGWTVTGGPEFIKLSAYKNTQGELVYVNESDTSSWTQPYLTSDGVMGGDTCAVESDVTFIGTEDKTYYGFNGDNINCFHSANGATKGYFTFYSPDAINVTQITFTNQGTNYRRASGSGIIWGSNDNINFEYISSYTNNSSNNTWNIDLSSNTKYYKYYKLYSNGTKGDSYWTFEDCHFTATYIDGTLYDSDFVPEQTSYNKIFEGLQNSYVVGTLTNNNGVFSGFQNNANYINYFNSTKYPTVNNLEILFKVKTGSSFSGSDRIMNDATSADNFVVGCVESNAWLRINDSDNKGVGIPLTYATNTDYWFKFTYNADNDGTYKGYYSTDGVNWSEPSVQENPLAPAINMQQFNFGLRTTGVDNVCVWKGSIDLPNSYIIINDDKRIFYNKQTGIIINNTFFARSPADDDYISR